MADKAFKCSQCDASYDTKVQLTGHMRKHSTKPKKKDRGRIFDTTSMVCPECERECQGKAALAHHRNKAHGVKGESRLEKDRREATKQLRTLPTPTPAVERINHAEEKQSGANERKPGNVVPNGHFEIDPFIFAIAVGQAKEFCRNLAEEHDVPARLFTRQFAELFLRQTRR